MSYNNIIYPSIRTVLIYCDFTVFIRNTHSSLGFFMFYFYNNKLMAQQDLLIHLCHIGVLMSPKLILTRQSSHVCLFPMAPANTGLYLCNNWWFILVHNFNMRFFFSTYSKYRLYDSKMLGSYTINQEQYW